MESAIIQERVTAAAIELISAPTGASNQACFLDQITEAAVRGLPLEDRSLVLRGLKDLLEYL